MEDYTYHLVRGQERVLGAHMLEVCPSIAAGKPSLETHPLGIGGKADPCRLVFDAAPGPAVNATLIDLGSRLRLIVAETDAVPPDRAMRRRCACFWRRVPMRSSQAGTETQPCYSLPEWDIATRTRVDRKPKLSKR